MSWRTSYTNYFASLSPDPEIILFLMSIFLSSLVFLLKFHIRSKILFVTSSFWLTPYLQLPLNHAVPLSEALIPCIYFLHIPKALFCYLCITVLVLMDQRGMLKLQIQDFNFPIWYPVDQCNKNNSFEKTPIQLPHLSYGVWNRKKNPGFSSENKFLMKKCNL